MISILDKILRLRGDRNIVLEAPLIAPEPDRVEIDWQGDLKRQFPDVYEACAEATQEVLDLVPEGDYRRLALHSPGLTGYDWRSYIGLSLIRIVRTLDQIRIHHPGARSLLDFGSYFGNLSLAAQKLGYDVHALDSYRDYHPALTAERALMEARGIAVIDSSGNYAVLDGYGTRFDAIAMLGVVEHVPHSPKPVLEAAHTHLAPGGLFVVETPNLAYLYRREQLMRGESVYQPIATQFHCPPPFEGHHREFTATELRWMLGETGFAVVEETLFNYSVLGSPQVGEDARRYREMEADPGKREIILMSARSAMET